MSYVLRRLVSLNVAVRCTHHCLTAPSRFNGHPTGMSESSSSPSPCLSMTVPISGTSIVALRLMCGLLHCHVSKDNDPRAATSSSAAKVGYACIGITSSLMESRSPCSGSRLLVCLAAAVRAILKPGGAENLTFHSIRRLGKLNMLTTQAMIDGGNHPCWNEYVKVVDVPDYIPTSRFES